MRWRKRYLIALPFLLFWVASKMEFCAFRYDPSEVLSEVGKGGELMRDTTRADGLHYLAVTEDSLQACICFVHGSPGSLWDYRQYLSDRELQSKANLISVDRQGYGFSAFGYAEGSLRVHAGQLISVIETRDCKDLILVGHSYGGPVVALAAMMNPLPIDGLILIAPSVSPVHEPGNGWRKVLDFYPLRWLTPPALRVCNQEIIPLREELKQMEGGWKGLNISTTVIQGTADRLVPMENALFIEQEMANPDHLKVQLLERDNHFILWSRTEIIRDEILSMLNEVQAD